MFSVRACLSQCRKVSLAGTQSCKKGFLKELSTIIEHDKMGNTAVLH
jgi:hypothetical protein